MPAFIPGLNVEAANGSADPSNAGANAEVKPKKTGFFAKIKEFFSHPFKIIDWTMKTAGIISLMIVFPIFCELSTKNFLKDIQSSQIDVLKQHGYTPAQIRSFV